MVLLVMSISVLTVIAVTVHNMTVRSVVGFAIVKKPAMIWEGTVLTVVL